MASAHQPNQQQNQLAHRRYNYLFHVPAILESAPKRSFTPQHCLALRKFIKSVVFSPNGKADEAVYEDALEIMGSDKSLRSLAIANRRNHEASEQLKRQELFMQQQRLSSRIGGAFISFFPIKLLQHISSYLNTPSRALFAVALGNFDMSSFRNRDCVRSKELSTASVIKRRKISEGLPLPQRASCGLGDVPMEALQHVAGFLAAPSQVMFGLHVAAAEDKSLNKSSFAIAGQQSWDILDFGEIEKEVAWRLTDDDIMAVLWCIDAGNRVKRLRLTNCVNITGSGLEPLSGSEVIEQIDLSLVGDHEEPIPLETWHPPLCLAELSTSIQSDYHVCFQIDPRLSRDLVLPVLDSIISREGCSLKHLHFPKQEELCRQSSWEGWQEMTDSIYHEWLPHPLFADFLSRYTEYMVNRGISCAKCNRNVPSSNGYQWFGNDRKLGFTFFNQNHTCSKCLNNYCYRCNDEDAQAYSRSNTSLFGDDRVLERCKKCEREYCVECSDMFQCWGDGCGDGYFCKDCKEASLKCSHNNCGNKCCSDCDLKFCRECEKKYCSSCCQHCVSCEEYICHSCEFTCEDCSAEDCENSMCAKCAADGCQKCKRAFCGCEYTNRCQYCEQTFCRDCDTFRKCEGSSHWNWKGNQCSGCDEKGPKGLADFNFVSRCESCDRDLCGNCRFDPSHQRNPMNCAGCTRLLNETLGIHI